MLEHVGILPITAQSDTQKRRRLKRAWERKKRGRENAKERERGGHRARATEERDKGGKRGKIWFRSTHVCACVWCACVVHVHIYA